MAGGMREPGLPRLSRREAEAADWLVIPRAPVRPAPGAEAEEDSLFYLHARRPFAALDLVLHKGKERLWQRLCPSAALPALLARLDGPLAGRLRQRLCDLRQAPAPLRLPGGRTLEPLRAGMPLVMGIVNVTPDSFSDGGRFLDPQAAIDHGRRLAAAGADILDVGGESTRPGAEPVAAEEERARVLPVVEALAAEGHIVSIDTRNSRVAAAAVAAGAAIINDVSAGTHDPDMAAVAAEADVPVVLMHAQGEPRSMQENPRYDDVLLEVVTWLKERMQAFQRAGVAQSRIIVDPGIGFGKRLEHNLALIRDLAAFHSLGRPVMLGASRKSFIAALGGAHEADRRIGGSIAAALAAEAAGVQLVRVHDVHETREALLVARALSYGKEIEG